MSDEGPLEQPEPAPSSGIAPDAGDPVPATAEAEAGATSGPSRSDHTGLVVFLGVLALILLLVGSVVGGLALDGGRARNDTGGPGNGHAYGLQKQQSGQGQGNGHAYGLQKQNGQGQGNAGKKDKPQKNDEQQAEPEEAAAIPVTLSGVVASSTTDDGDPVYTLTPASGSALTLAIGPARYWGDHDPLKPLVGKTATVTGAQEADSTEVAVYTVDGTVIRGPGKPPWAGGGTLAGQASPAP